MSLWHQLNKVLILGSSKAVKPGTRKRHEDSYNESHCAKQRQTSSNAESNAYNSQIDQLSAIFTLRKLELCLVCGFRVWAWLSAKPLSQTETICIHHHRLHYDGKGVQQQVSESTVAFISDFSARWQTEKWANIMPVLFELHIKQTHNSLPLLTDW